MVLPVGGLDVLEVIGVLFVVLIDLLAEQRDGVSAKSNKVGSGCSTVVELTPGNLEVVGSIPTKCWAFSVNVGIEWPILPHFFLFPINKSSLN